MRDFFRDYIDNDINLGKKQLIGVLCLVIVISGMFGWIYEFIFYFFNGGMEKFYWRGGNFLPWINIYATGAVIILITAYRFRKRPILVFLLSVISTGLLEFFSGYVIYEFFDLRFWNYNTEIFNFGNIGGFVCLRSVCFFGLSSLLLMYVIFPVCIFISNKVNINVFFILSICLCSLFLFDEFYNLIFARLFDLPRAHDVYESIGFNFMNYK